MLLPSWPENIVQGMQHTVVMFMLLIDFHAPLLGQILIHQVIIFLFCLMLLNGQNQFAMADPAGFGWQNCLMFIQELHITNLSNFL